MSDAPKMTREHVDEVEHRAEHLFAMSARQHRLPGGRLDVEMAEYCERKGRLFAEVAAFLRSHTDD